MGTKLLTGVANVVDVHTSIWGTYVQVLFEGKDANQPPMPWLYVGATKLNHGDVVVALKEQDGINHYKKIGDVRYEHIPRCRLSKSPLTK